MPDDRVVVDEPNLHGVEGTLITDEDNKRVLILCPKPIAQHFLVSLTKEQARRIGPQLTAWGNEP